MVNYGNGKIYKIVCNVTNQIYIGSTTKDRLCQRLTKHVGDFKRYKQDKCGYITSFRIIENNNYSIVLLENYPCKNKDELQSRERFWIEQNDCVNKIIPTRSRKEYLLANKEKIKNYKREYDKQYSELNKLKIQEYRKNYYKNNKEKIKEKANNYYKNNKSVNEISHNKTCQIQQTNKKLFSCECGSIMQINAKARHKKSKKHQTFEKSQNK
eukprot:gene8462-gene263